MSKTNEQDQQFARLVSALLERVNAFAGDQINPTLTSAFDALQLIDGKVTRKNLKRHRSTLLCAAASMVKFADAFKSSSYDPLRHVLHSNAINLVMVVVESLEAEGDKKAADALFRTAYDYAKLMKSWNEDFPAESLILGSLGFNEHKAPVKLVADVAETRRRLVAYHGVIKENLSRIDANLGSCEHILRGIISKRDSVLHLFEMDLGDHILYFRPGKPYCFGTAASWIATLRQHIDGIDREKADEATVNRSRRAILVAQMVEGYVKATLAHAYVEYWRSYEGYESFSVLGHQALAYAEACRGNNFTYFGPLALIRQEEPITERSEGHIRMLIGYGEAALAYAEALHCQMRLVPTASRAVKAIVPVKVAKTEKNAEPEAKPERFPSINSYVNLETSTQEEIASSHCLATGEDMREDAAYGRGRRDIVNPKQRIVGFDRGRGGRNSKKKRRSA